MQKENNILLQFCMQTFKKLLLILIFQAYTNTWTVHFARSTTFATHKSWTA